MAKKDPGVLSAILSAQKEKTGTEGPSLKNIEDALSNVGGSISAADFKRLLSGQDIESAPSASAGNVAEMAQDIKDIVENTSRDASTSIVNTEKISELVEIQKDLLPSPEEKSEELDLFKDQNELLNRIEENTRPFSETSETTNTTTAKSSSGGFLSGIMGFLGGGLAGGIGGLFGGAAGGAIGGSTSGIGSMLTKGIMSFIGNIFKSLLKGTAITMLVGGLVSGLIDGIEEYKKSGSIKDALWKGFVGFIDFLSFGLIDEEDINSIKDSIKEKGIFGFLADSISGLVTNAIDFITGTDLFQDLKKQYEDVGIGMMLVNGLKSWATAIIDLWFGEGTADKVGESVVNKFNEIKELATGFVDTIKNFYNELIDSFVSLIKEIHIPKFGFNIDMSVFGLGNKEFSFGPYYPFGKNEELINTTSENTTSSTSVTNSSDVLISKSENTTAEKVISQNEDNAWIQQNMMSTGAPTTIYAPTSNTVSSQTTVAPKIEPRNNEPAAIKYAGGSGW